MINSRKTLFSLLTVILLTPMRVNACDVTPMYSPKGGIEQAIIKEIDNATGSIEVAAYQFTSKPISEALEREKRKGVDVRVVVDGRQVKQTGKYLGSPTFPIRFNSKYAIFHNKFMIIDGQTVETGSFNYTASAEKRNAENIVIIKNCPDVVAAYKQNFQKLWEEAE